MCRRVFDLASPSSTIYGASSAMFEAGTENAGQEEIFPDTYAIHLGTMARMVLENGGLAANCRFYLDCDWVAAL